MTEQPKMAPHIPAMRHNIALTLHCDVTQINVKATRGEKQLCRGKSFLRQSAYLKMCNSYVIFKQGDVFTSSFLSLRYLL